MHETTAPPTPAGFVVGLREAVCLGHGWHEPETAGPGGMPYRATAERAVFTLRVSAGARALHLLAAAPVSRFGEPYRGRLTLGGRAIGEIVLARDGWALRRVALPPGNASASGIFMLESAQWFEPAAVVAGSRDARRLSCMIAAAVVR